jgi:hypothetical protein
LVTTGTAAKSAFVISKPATAYDIRTAAEWNEQKRTIHQRSILCVKHLSTAPQGVGGVLVDETTSGE